MKRALKILAANLGYEIKKKENILEHANPSTLGKAITFIERHKEIISDPLNLLINRVPEAGYLDKSGCVILHNGNRVPHEGPLAYYDSFSDILILNRGVHEPLEEFCFQVLLSKMRNSAPLMMELGSYWAHYSMWLKKNFPHARCYMVEPDPRNLECGVNNFAINGYEGEFINASVGPSDFCLDKFAASHSMTSLDILHSDIQGYELDMLSGARLFLAEHKANYIFISTHSQDLHSSVVEQLKNHSYRVEVDSNFHAHTTSLDGFVFASSPKVEPVFQCFCPLGRLDILRASPDQLLNAISSIRY